MAAEEHRFLLGPKRKFVPPVASTDGYRFLLGPKRKFVPPVASAEDYRFLLGPKRRFVPPVEPAARVRAEHAVEALERLRSRFGAAADPPGDRGRIAPPDW